MIERNPAGPWFISDAEWERVGTHLAVGATRARGPGRPSADLKTVAEACLWHHFQSKAPVYRSSGWHQLPRRDFAVSPATANRWYRRWDRSRSWQPFVRELLKRRAGRAGNVRAAVQSPIRAVIAQLERSYSFLNMHLFANTLPREVAITVSEIPASRCLAYFRRAQPDGPLARVIALSFAALRDGPDGAHHVLLHEMVHLRNNAVGIPDTRGGKYHNKHFRDTAALAGLDCGRWHPTRGYARTRLNPTGEAAVAHLRRNRKIFAPFAQVPRLASAKVRAVAGRHPAPAPTE